MQRDEREHSQDLRLFQQLSGQVAAGQTEAGAAWTAVFERLANLYFANDTPALLALVADADKLPLPTAVARQTHQYFQGVAAFRQDRYGAAQVIFDDLLAAPDLPLTLRARTLNARAVICRLTGRLEEAMRGYQASLTLWQALGDDHYQGIVHLNLGIITYGLRRYAEADDHLRQAEQFFRAAGSAAWLRKVQSELGLVQRDLGHWDAALAYFDAYVAQSQAAGADEDVGAGEANRGEVLLFKGDLAGAKTALHTALRLLVSRTYRVDHLLHLGLAHQAEGDLAGAEAFYRQALAVAQEIGRREILPHVHYHLGDVLRRQNDNEAALAHFAAAAAIIQATRTPLRDEALKISLLGRWQQVYEALVLHNLARERPWAAFAWAERARARAFAEGLTDQGHLPPTPEPGDDIGRAVQAALPPEATLLCYFTTGVLEQDAPLLRAIPPDNPLRDHLLLPPRILLFVLTRGGLTVHECPLNPNLFATGSPRGFEAQRFLQTAVRQRLRRDLLPVNHDPDVRGTDHEPRLIIIPHGPLHRVPFTALLHAANGPVIGYAPSGAIFARQRAQRPSGRGGLAVGYDGEVGNGRLLRYAEAEVRRVAQLMKGGQSWTGREPQKGRLREAAAACRWLHIACHGWFDDADPLASYLETGAGERLTARDVLENWTLRAELVTLSACETGVSQILRGDEPMGLVRAFLSAGARTVLVTQWPVDDLATFLLMGRFYELVGGEADSDLGAALHEAQRWLMNLTVPEAQSILAQWAITPPAEWAEWADGRKPYSEPEFWAGFVLVGGS